MRSPAVRNMTAELLLNGAALAAAGVVCAAVISAFGENPAEVFRVFLDAVCGSWTGILYTLFYTTPLIFTGLAVGIAFHGGLFNIGAEGQLNAGAFAAAWVGFTFTSLPGWLLVPAAIGAAAAAGGVWGWIPGYLKGKFGSHEVINTIMMNYIAAGVLGYLVANPFKSAGDQILQTEPIAPQAHIPLLTDLLSFTGINLPKSAPLNASLILAVAAALFLYLLLKKTVPGYEIRAAGLSPAAAKASGINTTRTVAITMFISGAAAGLVGVNEILGYRHRFLFNFSPGYGFTGIAIALMGKNNPLGIMLSALLFGAIMRGGLMLDIYFERISKDIMYVFQGVIILFIAARAFKTFLDRRKTCMPASPAIHSGKEHDD